MIIRLELNSKSEEVIEIEELIYTVKLPRIDYLIKEDANSIILDLENIKAIYNKNKKISIL